MICPDILTFVQTLLLSLGDISHPGGSWVFSLAGIGAFPGAIVWDKVHVCLLH